MVDHGADIRAVGQDTATVRNEGVGGDAAAEGRARAISGGAPLRSMIAGENGADIETMVTAGTTSLHVAAQLALERMVQVLRHDDRDRYRWFVSLHLGP